MSVLLPLSSFLGIKPKSLSMPDHVGKMESAVSSFVTHFAKNPKNCFYLPLSSSKDWLLEKTYSIKDFYGKATELFPKSLKGYGSFPPEVPGGNITSFDIGLPEIQVGAGGVPPIDPGAPVTPGEPQAALPNIIPPLQPITDVISKIQEKALAALPFFLIALYRSKQEHLQNVNLTIKASSHAKVYQIGLGLQKGSELSVAFEILAGKNIRFLREKEAFTSSILPQAIFKPSLSLASKVIGPLKHLIWKRQDAYTSCNVIIEDAGNPLLKNGPLTAFIQVSERESFYILHKDPNVTLDNSEASDFVIRTEDSNFASFKALSLTVSDPLSPNEEHHKQIIPLPFDEKRQDQYLSIRQWQ